MGKNSSTAQQERPQDVQSRKKKTPQVVSNATGWRTETGKLVRLQRSSCPRHVSLQSHITLGYLKLMKVAKDLQRWHQLRKFFESPQGLHYVSRSLLRTRKYSTGFKNWCKVLWPINFGIQVCARNMTPLLQWFFTYDWTVTNYIQRNSTASLTKCNKGGNGLPKLKTNGWKSSCDDISLLIFN